MKNWIFIVILIFVFTSSAVFSQKYSQYDLPDQVEYTSLKDAMKMPDSVYILKLKRKHLKQFPKEILKLKNLRVLILSVNKIYSLPDELAQLDQLEELDISGNKFVYFPKVITQLKNLKTLKFSRNEILEIPEEIGNLKNLEQLVVWDNPLTNLPDNIAKLKDKIKRLNLSMTLIKDKDIMNKIRNLLPDTKIEFPSPCDCLK